MDGASRGYIDIKRTFTDVGNVKIFGEVVDSEDEKNKTRTNSVEVYWGP